VPAWQHQNIVSGTHLAVLTVNHKTTVVCWQNSQRAASLSHIMCLASFFSLIQAMCLMLQAADGEVPGLLQELFCFA
jgi:hypothetical protein